MDRRRYPLNHWLNHCLEDHKETSLEIATEVIWDACWQMGSRYWQPLDRLLVQQVQLLIRIGTTVDKDNLLCIHKEKREGGKKGTLKTNGFAADVITWAILKNEINLDAICILSETVSTSTWIASIWFLDELGDVHLFIPVHWALGKSWESNYNVFWFSENCFHPVMTNPIFLPIFWI